MTKRVLLIQIREPSDAMLHHELQCVAQRLSGLDATLVSENAVVKPILQKELAGVDGVVIGGSGDFSVEHPLSLRFVTPMLKTLDILASLSIPTFGICFGHQLIGYWLGRRVPTDPARSELGTVQVSKTRMGKQHPVLADLPMTFAAHSGHSDVVLGCPEGCDIILSNDLLDTQAFQVRGAPMMSVQFHPDMTGAEARARLLAYREGFSDRIDTDAASFAEKFAIDQDESTTLLSAFFRVHGFS